MTEVQPVLIPKTVEKIELGPTNFAVSTRCFMIDGIQVTIKYGSGVLNISVSNKEGLDSRMQSDRRLTIASFQPASGLFILEDLIPAKQTLQYWMISQTMDHPLLFASIRSTSVYKNIYINHSLLAVVDQCHEITLHLFKHIGGASTSVPIEGKQVTALSISTSSLDAECEKHVLSYITDDQVFQQNEYLVVDGKLELLEKHYCDLRPSTLKQDCRLTKLVDLSCDGRQNHFIAIGSKAADKIAVIQFSMIKNNISFDARIQKEMIFNNSILSHIDQLDEKPIFVVRRRDSSETVPRSVFITILARKAHRILTLVIQERPDSTWNFNKMVQNACDEDFDLPKTEHLNSLLSDSHVGNLPFMKKDSPLLYFLRTEQIFSASALNLH